MKNEQYKTLAESLVSGIGLDVSSTLNVLKVAEARLARERQTPEERAFVRDAVAWLRAQPRLPRAMNVIAAIEGELTWGILGANKDKPEAIVQKLRAVHDDRETHSILKAAGKLAKQNARKESRAEIMRLARKSDE